MPAPGPCVTLIRHGETQWSRSGQHTGRTDVPLTPAGERQARSLGEVLKSSRFDLVLVSPLQRARRTAELAGLSPVQVLDDLHEWDYGEMEGRTTPEIQRSYPGWSIWDGPWPGGETAGEVAERADRVIARLRTQPPSSSVAIVAHGHVLRALGARWVGAPVTAGRWLALGTAAVCRLGWEHAQPVVQLWNRTDQDTW